MSGTVLVQTGYANVVMGQVSRSSADGMRQWHLGFVSLGADR